MFETEAGFAETKMLINCNGDYSKKQDYKKGWQDGAEFGYNKCKEEMQKNGLALQSDMDKTIEQNMVLKEEIRQLKNEVEDLRAYCNQIGKIKTEVMKAFKDIVAR